MNDLLMNKNSIIHHFTIDCICFILSLSFELVVITHSCSKSGKHSDDIGCMLHKFNTVNNQSFSDLIKDFALQIIHEKIVFDACGFFSFDYGLLVSVSLTLGPPGKFKKLPD